MHEEVGEALTLLSQGLPPEAENLINPLFIKKNNLGSISNGGEESRGQT
jgi:hypothetical protein